MDAVFLFCTDAGAGPDGKMNINGIFNELLAPDFPARQDRMVLAGVIEWQDDVAGRIPFRMDFNDPQGMSVFTIEGHTDVETRPAGGAPARTQFILPMTNVMFPAAGRYRMQIEINGEELVGPSMYLYTGPRSN
jgi:hypothetical protein